jgi:hypothetical protein
VRLSKNIVKVGVLILSIILFLGLNLSVFLK